MTTRTWTSYADRTLRGVLSATFLAAAAMKLSSSEFEVAGFRHFGYPLWFMYAVGGAQLIGAGLLWIRGYAAYGAALLAIVMVGAVASHLRAGDALAIATPAFVLLVLCAGTALARRRDGRLTATRIRIAEA